MERFRPIIFERLKEVEKLSYPAQNYILDKRAVKGITNLGLAERLKENNLEILNRLTPGEKEEVEGYETQLDNGI